MLKLDNLKPFDRNPNAAVSIIVGETEEGISICGLNYFSLFKQNIRGFPEHSVRHIYQIRILPSFWKMNVENNMS